MKKIIPVLALLILCNSCTADEEIKAPVFPIESFLGSWSYNTITIDGETAYYPHREQCHRDHFEIHHEEGKWNQFLENIYLNDDCANQGTYLDWKINGDILNLYFGEQLVVTYKILSVTQNNLSLLYKVDVDNDGEKEDVIINAIYYDPFERFER